jgi:hypothetical protein
MKKYALKYANIFVGEELVSKAEFTQEHAKKVLALSGKKGEELNDYAQKIFDIVDDNGQLALLAEAGNTGAGEPLAPAAPKATNPRASRSSKKKEEVTLTPDPIESPVEAPIEAPAVEEKEVNEVSADEAGNTGAGE